MYWDGIRKAKLHLELNLVRDMKVKRQVLYRHTSSIRKARGNVGLLLNSVGYLLKGYKKVKVPSSPCSLWVRPAFWHLRS